MVTFTFCIEKIKQDKYRVVMYKKGFGYSFVGNVARYLNVEVNQLNDAIEKYNGFCTKWVENYSDEECKFMHFKNEEDAKKFITNYLEPLSVMNLIDN